MIPKVSVIIPVYNAGSFFRRLLNSLISQSFTDWECIIVDDGSTDGSSGICDEYAVKDTRISVVHKENDGVSTARNIGIEKASGEWLFFCDADDELLPDGLKTLVYGANEDVDLACGGYVECDDDGNIINETYQELSLIISKEEMIHHFALDNMFGKGYPWCKLYRNSTVRKLNLSFNPSISFAEDLLFAVQYVCRCDGSIFLSSVPMYRYYHHECSLIGNHHKFYHHKNNTNISANLQVFYETKQIGISRQDVKRFKKQIINTFDIDLKIAKKFGQENDLKFIKKEMIHAIGFYFYYKYRLLETFSFNIVAEWIKKYGVKFNTLFFVLKGHDFD